MDTTTVPALLATRIQCGLALYLERLEGIAKGYKPPPAGPESLRPSPEALEKAEVARQKQGRMRSMFFQRSR